jgi:DNA-3-methyladenine glycosylase I
MEKIRCPWAGSDPLYIEYHDKEWGKPIFDDRLLFEFLILEGMQAGLSWSTILKKRANFRMAFNNFEAKKIGRYDQAKVEALLENTGIIRNRLKIEAAIQNAKIFLDIQKEFGSFSQYIWQFVDHKPLINNWKSLSEIPAETTLSKEMSKSLKDRGFKFVGSTICYAFMQAVGMVNDHIITCFRYEEIV